MANPGIQESCSEGRGGAQDDQPWPDPNYMLGLWEPLGEENSGLVCV